MMVLMGYLSFRNVWTIDLLIKKGFKGEINVVVNVISVTAEKLEEEKLKKNPRQT